jgi:hypothetical protein
MKDRYLYSCHNTVTHMTIARQRLGKHIPGVMLSTTEGHTLLGNGHSRTTEEKYFPWGLCRGTIRESNSEAGSCRVEKNTEEL